MVGGCIRCPTCEKERDPGQRRSDETLLHQGGLDLSFHCPKHTMKEIATRLLTKVEEEIVL